MEVTIEEISKNQDEEIIIKCHAVDDNILKLINKLKANSSVLIGFNDDNIHRLKSTASK